MKTDLICLAKSIEEIYAHLLKKQSTPRQGTRNHCNTVLLQQFYFETIHTPLGDGKDIPAIAFGMFMKHNQRPDRGQKRAVIFE